MSDADMAGSRELTAGSPDSRRPTDSYPLKMGSAIDMTQDHDINIYWQETTGGCGCLAGMEDDAVLQWEFRHT